MVLDWLSYGLFWTLDLLHHLIQEQGYVNDDNNPKLLHVLSLGTVCGYKPLRALRATMIYILHH